MTLGLSTPGPFPVPSFQPGHGGEATAADLLDFLQKLVSTNLDNDPTVRIPSSSKDTWIVLISGLSEHFIATFPSPRDASWNALHEKTQLSHITLDVIFRAAQRVDELIHYQDPRSHAVSLQLLKLLAVLDEWSGAKEVDEHSPSIEDLHSKALEALTTLLQCYGEDHSSEGSGYFRHFVNICLESVDSIGSMQTPAIFALPPTPPTDGGSPGDSKREIVLENRRQLHRFMLDVLLLLSRCARNIDVRDNFMGDFSRKITLSLHTSMHHILPLASTMAGTDRAIPFVCGLAIIDNLAPFVHPVSAVINSMLTSLLLLRIKNDSEQCWTEFDGALYRMTRQQDFFLEPLSHVHDMVQVLLGGVWVRLGQEAQDALCNILKSTVLRLGPEISKLIQSTLQQANEAGPLAAVFAISEDVGSADLQVPDVLGKRKRGDVDEGFKKDVLAMLADAVPGEGDAIPDADNDQAWAHNCLDFVGKRFRGWFKASNADQQATLLKFLAQLPCNLTHQKQPDCFSGNSRITIAAIPVYIRLLNDITTNPNCSHSNRRQAYDAFARALRHHAAGFAEEKLESAKSFIFRGIENEQRGVRVAAGRALVELIRLYKKVGRAASRLLDATFITLESLYARQTERIQETAFLTLGLIGKLQDSDILGRTLHVLVSQLGHGNIALKATAYTQLISLGRHYQKAPYALIAPYMQRLSVFIVSNICAQPNILLEFCRFISYSPNDFLRSTLPHTVPSLFGSSNKEALEMISKELEMKISSLFLNASPEILTHILTLDNATSSDTAIKFILSVLSQAANNKITISNVLKSCAVPLLANLVIATGDEDLHNQQAASRAIRKVESLLASVDSSRPAPSQHVGNFLKNYVFGIITHMNDVLQDIRGRRSVPEKQEVIRGLGYLILQIGPPISSVAPQVMATLQTTVSVDSLTDVTLETWHNFLTTLSVNDLGPYVGPITASLVDNWPKFSSNNRQLAKKSLEYILMETSQELGDFLDDVVDLSRIPELRDCAARLEAIRRDASPEDLLNAILERMSTDNKNVVGQSLEELKALLLGKHQTHIRGLASGDAFDQVMGDLMKSLLSVASRDGDETEHLRLLAFECIGIIGALDPDRFDVPWNDERMVVQRNFGDDTETVTFVIHVIRDVLVGAYRSTSDIAYQSHLAYAIQELLRFCKFTPDLVMPGGNASIPNKVRKAWNGLPKHVLETVTPLLEARYTRQSSNSILQTTHPIYPSRATYREWVQAWTEHLITKASGSTARIIFDTFRAVVRNRDVGVAHFLLPHLVLNIMISGADADADNIRLEMVAVLEDQMDASSASSFDKRLLSAQTIFMLMDHLSKWIRFARHEISSRRSDGKRTRHAPSNIDQQLVRVDSILGSINSDLVAKAAFECKAYARALMNFEGQIIELKNNRNAPPETLQPYYERLHEIYAQLDEPDGMEGISTCILAPSLEHQIRQHESTGRWTSAQSCWEVRLQQSPDNLDYHIGLLKCLRNLGHYDTLRTHIDGIATRNPEWAKPLAGFQVESAWMVNDYKAVERIISKTATTENAEVAVGRLLLAMRSRDEEAISSALASARLHLGAPLTASGVRSYRNAYDSILNLHLVQDLQTIHESLTVANSQRPSYESILSNTSTVLNRRLDSTLPTFRIREPILSMHRTALSLTESPLAEVKVAISQSWLASAKIARKAGHWQTAYSAVLQAQENNDATSFYQSAKLVKAAGEPLRALYELENALKIYQNRPRDGQDSDTIDLTVDEENTAVRDDEIAGKAKLLRARWKQESDRYDASVIIKELTDLTKSLPRYESSHFYAGHFQDECYKALSQNDRKIRGARMNLHTIKAYSMAVRTGSKYVYQAIPRLLTLWLDMGEDASLCNGDVFPAINHEIEKAIQHAPTYKWLTAFPQILSRVDHKNDEVFLILGKLIVKVLQEYPQQGLWQFMSVVKSTKSKRMKRGKDILDALKASSRHHDTAALVLECVAMATELLNLCDYPIKDDNTRTLSLSKHFSSLAKLTPSKLIIPLQESLTVTLPSSSVSRDHRPFPLDAPTIMGFLEEIDVMKSLAKPRKITIRGSDGLQYMFLGKPKDDLRKDARLMDFNSIINKLLKKNSDSRRRQLHIRTYSVVTLNEECGFIQWVPNTTPIRPILLKLYGARGIDPWNRDMGQVFQRIKEANDKDGAQLFEDKILTIFPPVFHEWFIETFPEPSAWLSSRLAYGRTAAVMSMVGFILGLGDRHLENILLDTVTGDAVHVDFNCLFERGKALETPERVPFRLTHNMVAALGVTGVEGPFRIAAEIVMQLLRDNKDALMSVLDAFVHDPLVEWEDEKRKRERMNRGNAVKESVDLRKLARHSLAQIEKKLRGLYTKETNRNERRDKEVSTSNLVQMLIEESMDLRNLAKMYPGWAPWH